ncbi:MAG: TonB-dependent receptor, partial [Pseudomonadota bacterium]
QPFGDESLVFDLTYFNVDSDSNPFGLVSNETGDLFDRIQVVDVDDEYPFDFEQFGLEAQWQINDHWSFTSITGYNEIDIAQRFDGDISAFDFLSVVANIDEEIFSQELRLTYDIDDFSVLVGAYYSDGDFGFGFSGSGLFPDPITGDFVPFSTITDNIEVITQQAIFSKVHWDITDDWHLDFGVRLNREERDTDNFADNNGAVSDLSASETFSTVIPSFAVTYDLNSSTSVGVSYARGVQAGGIAFAVFLGQSQPYDEEYTDNYEAFVRYSSEDGEFMVNANVFYVDWTDQQVTTTPAGGFPGFDDLVENAGESSIRGIEVEVEWQATPALMTFVSLALNKTEFEAFVLNGVDFSGTRFPQSPKSNFALGFIYQGNSGFYASSTFSYVDSTFTDLQAPQDTEISSRSLLSARVGYEWEDWQFYVWGENLLDDEYELGLFDGSAFGLNSAYGRLGEPRILGIGVDVSW